MRKELMIATLVLGTLVLMMGCSNTADDNPDVTATTGSLEDTTADTGGDDSRSGDADTMRFCESTKQTDLMKYEYYWTEDEYYEKVTTSNGGETTKVATPEQVCVKLKGSSVEGWDCNEGTEALFQETKGVVQDLLESPVDMYGLECEDKPYDETIFETS